jgi:hypothetical protein
MTKQQYIEYLVATPNNYTCTHLANHLEGEAATSHDTISDYLRREKLTPRRLWEVVEALLHDTADSYLIVDDSVQNKQYSQKIELVKLQFGQTAIQWGRRRLGAWDRRGQSPAQQRKSR